MITSSPYKKIRLAIALTDKLTLPEKHFGESDKFFIYETCGRAMRFLKSIPNPYRDIEEDDHGNPQKGKDIAMLLKQSDIEAVVSIQFGKNITIVSQHFLPVIVKSNKLEQVKKALEYHCNDMKEQIKEKHPSEDFKALIL